MLKKILPILLLVSILLPFTASAQIDPRCWRKMDCTDEGGTFYEGQDAALACGAKDATGNALGFCTAAGDAETAISFGGQTKFTNIGTFINFIYRYGVTIAGILAVIMIIIAGAQWILSAGSPERINSAKKRIAGATVGVLIAALSYVILNTINPYLVNLRLPQVWMVNRQGLAPPRCDQVTGAGIAHAGISGTTIDKQKAAAKKYESKEQTIPKCGNEYFVESTGGQTCTGTFCDPGNLCYRGIKDKVESCKKATIAGIIRASSLTDNLIAQSGLLSFGASIFGQGWEWEWANEPDLYIVCKNGDYKNITSDSQSNAPDNDNYTNEDDRTQEYWIRISSLEIDAAATKCSNNGGVRGFAIGIDLNEEGDPISDEEHFLGMNRATNEAIDLGKDQDETTDNIFNKDCVNPYLLTADEIKKGVYLPIDVSKICDIDTFSEGENQRKKCYDLIGYNKTSC
jgi:hypothetical protein